MRATLAVLAAALAAAAGCASLATPEAPELRLARAGQAACATNVSQQVKDGGQLYVDLSCVRCHAPNGVGGIPNRLNVGGDSTIPPLNNQYRDKTEQFRNAVQITQVLDEGSIVSKKPGVINMPSWKGVITTAQADALAAYILAGLPEHGRRRTTPIRPRRPTSTALTPASTATGRWGSTRHRRRRRIRRRPTRRCLLCATPTTTCR